VAKKATRFQIERARSLRRQETPSEKLLWNVLRSKQLCNLKFRKQHPIPPFYADFACVGEMLVLEIDGDYHDDVGKEDLSREAFLRELGWDVIRFSDREVMEDVKAVARGIAKHLGLEYEFRKRKGTGSGMDNVKSLFKREK
jgi:very-short-patch-repair endonuclease